MKLGKLLLTLLILVLLGGFVYLAVIDVPVESQQVEKTIPNDRFFHEK